MSLLLLVIIFKNQTVETIQSHMKLNSLKGRRSSDTAGVIVEAGMRLVQERLRALGLDLTGLLKAPLTEPMQEL